MDIVKVDSRKMNKPKLASRIANQISVKVHTGKTMTEQSHREETDMNHILRDYVRTGLIKHAKDFEGKYDDIAAQDFQEAMFTVATAQSMFEELPAAIRKRFSNDPSRFLEFVHNPANANEMARLGILKGNDGIDVKGAATLAPTKEDVKAAADSPKESPPADSPPAATS